MTDGKLKIDDLKKSSRWKCTNRQEKRLQKELKQNKLNYAKKSYRILVTRKRDKRIKWDDDGKQTENKTTHHESFPVRYQ